MTDDAAYEPPETFDVFGVPVAVIDQDRFRASVETWLTQRTPKTPGRFICFCDAHGVVRSWSDPALAQAHRAALMVAPDGWPLSWLGRRQGHKMTQVCGPDTLLRICQAGLRPGWRHAFFGSTEQVLQDLTKRLRAAFPDIVVVATIAPPFGSPDSCDVDELADELRQARPDFVWVGLGSPKQEIWMARFAPRIEGALCMGVGAAFGFNAGHVRRAPAWFRAVGLEWLWRAACEPMRLGPRYAEVVPRFLAHVMAEEVKTGLSLLHVPHGVRPRGPTSVRGPAE